MEDVLHFLKWKEGCWAFTRDVGNDYQGPVADRCKCVHVCSWVIERLFFAVSSVVLSSSSIRSCGLPVSRRACSRTSVVASRRRSSLFAR